jgi:hypothetical protein
MANPTNALAQSKTLIWEQYHTEITVETDGDLRIVENQTIQFTSGTFTYGYRTIPMDKTDGITDIRIFEGNKEFVKSTLQNEYTFSVDEQDNELVVYWYFPPTSNASHTYTFKYTVQGGVKINPDEGDSVFWKAIPPDHDFPIKDGRATIRFPNGVEFGDIVSFGVNTEASTEGNTVYFVSKEGLASGEELEVGVAFAPGLIQANPPDWQQKEDKADTANLILGFIGILILITGLVGVLLLWYVRGRDPNIGLVAEYLTEPPSNIPPGVAGTLVDEKADIQDVIASLVDLARRGYLEMVESKASRGLFGLGGGKSEFDFRRTEKSWEGLLPFERKILSKVFGSRSERSLTDLRNNFYTAIPKIKKGLYKETVKRKFFRTDPDTVRGRYTGLGLGLLIVVGGIGFFAFTMLVDTAGAIICPFVAVGIVAIAIIIAGQAMPVKTQKGAEESAKWKAFKRYLQDIDRYTNLEEATDQFDKYLPFAIAFGLERSWINKFSSVPTTPVPIWYYPVWMGSHDRHTTFSGTSGSTGGGKTPSLDGMSKGIGTGLSSMSAGLVSMLNSTSSTLVSRPQSSGSSGGGGWSGGGFSGGGGGGGGSAGFG